MRHTPSGLLVSMGEFHCCSATTLSCTPPIPYAIMHAIAEHSNVQAQHYTLHHFATCILATVLVWQCEHRPNRHHSQTTNRSFSNTLVYTHNWPDSKLLHGEKFTKSSLRAFHFLLLVRSQAASISIKSKRYLNTANDTNSTSYHNADTQQNSHTTNGSKDDEVHERCEVRCTPEHNSDAKHRTEHYSNYILLANIKSIHNK